MMMNNILETERLVMRQMCADDAEFIIALVNSPGWLQYIGDRGIKTTEQAIDYIENRLNQHFRIHGFGYMIAIKKADNVPVGICGILRRDYLTLPDIGFALLPEFEGSGFAFEMTKATFEYGKSTLNLPKMCGITLEENQKSIRLLEKIGMTLSNKVMEDDVELLVYSC
jgi:RimJ/RimL family protein N-acetyltransferase